MAKRNPGGVIRKEITGQGGTAQRGWVVSLGWAAAIVGAGVVLSAVINPMLGRLVHWDWMAGLAPTLFLLFAVALRRRWI
jgi:hypothetical protein